MISCYSLEQPSSYSLVDVTDSLSLLSLSACLHLTAVGAQAFMQIGKTKMQKSLFSHFNSLFFRTLHLYKPLVFCFKGPPLLPDLVFLLSFIAYNYTSLRLPYLFISMEPTPSYTHQRWRVEEGGVQIWLQFQTALDFLLLRKRALGKLLFFL